MVVAEGGTDGLGVFGDGPEADGQRRRHRQQRAQYLLEPR